MQNESAPSLFELILNPNLVPKNAQNTRSFEVFRSLFPGKLRPQQIHLKSPPFFNAESPGKFKEKIHKSSLARKQSNTSPNFDKYLTTLVPLTGTVETLKNNRRDKFRTNLGFGAFLNAVRGRRGKSQVSVRMAAIG